MFSFRQFTKEEQDNKDISKLEIESARTSQPQNPSKPYKQFEEYKKLYQTSYLLYAQRKVLQNLIKELSQTIEQAQMMLLEETGSTIEQKQESKKQSENRRNRRKADDIQRKWECKEEYCDRKYGAHASLLQHVKLKHPNMVSHYY